ncbi:LacI family DNA-binding transcriptional regulator [Guptibacillus hwajinpoensis]|uniref:LacI family DNA-binding transcriptional regulator n=1 Tax=Guptibacillus hwajinpoensis TaxID=208199 RepID=UPI0034E52A02
MRNIRKIAEMAQVSRSTVSRVLNGYAYVSKEKEEAVWKAINETKYRKNINAVHLSRKNLLNWRCYSIYQPSLLRPTN